MNGVLRNLGPRNHERPFGARRGRPPADIAATEPVRVAPFRLRIQRDDYGIYWACLYRRLAYAGYKFVGSRTLRNGIDGAANYFEKQILKFGFRAARTRAPKGIDVT